MQHRRRSERRAGRSIRDLLRGNPEFRRYMHERELRVDRLMRRCSYGGNRKARSASKQLLRMGLMPTEPSWNLHECPSWPGLCRCRGGRGNHWKGTCMPRGLYIEDPTAPEGFRRLRMPVVIEPGVAIGMLA